MSASPSVDRVSGLVPASVQFPDTTGRLLPGISGMTCVSLETSTDAVVLPGRALRPLADGSLEAALVIDGTASLVRVETGISQGNRYQIMSGVAAGDSVIVLGSHLVEQGSRVTVVP